MSPGYRRFIRSDHHLRLGGGYLCVAFIPGFVVGGYSHYAGWTIYCAVIRLCWLSDLS